MVNKVVFFLDRKYVNNDRPSGGFFLSAVSKLVSTILCSHHGLNALSLAVLGTPWPPFPRYIHFEYRHLYNTIRGGYPIGGDYPRGGCPRGDYPIGVPKHEVEQASLQAIQQVGATEKLSIDDLCLTEGPRS